MTPDDFRHGTNAGYVAGCRYLCCRAAHADYRRGLRAKRYLRRVERLYVLSTGTQRRIRALQALGWRLGDLDAELGHPARSSYTMNLLKQERVHIDTAEAVAAMYERLSMTFGPSASLRVKAANWGFPPPLAWDDIDDPDETPKGWEYDAQPRLTRADILADLDANHAGISAACRALKITRDALERWCQRHEQRELYSRLVRREQPDYERYAGEAS